MYCVVCVLLQLFAIDLFHKEYCVGSLREFGCDAAADVYDRVGDLFDTFTANMWDHPRRESIIPFRMHALGALRELRDIGVYPNLIFIDADWHKERLKALLQTIFEYVVRPVDVNPTVAFSYGTVCLISASGRR